MTRLVVILALLAVVAFLARCRRCPDLCAHSEYDRYVLWCPDKCDPRTDELQRLTDAYYQRMGCIAADA